MRESEEVHDDLGRLKDLGNKYEEIKSVNETLNHKSCALHKNIEGLQNELHKGKNTEDRDTNNQAKKPTKVSCRLFLFSSCRYVCLTYSDWYCLAKMNPRF